MKNLSITISIVTFCIFVGAGLKADSLSTDNSDAFSKGNFFITISYGKGVPEGDALDFYKTTSFFRNEITKNMLSLNSQRQILGFYQYHSLKDLESNSMFGNLGFEYALTGWFGVGLSISNIKGFVDNVKFYETYEYFLLLGSDPNTPCFGADDCINEPVRYYEYTSALNVEKSIGTMTSLDLDISFHFPSPSKWDPYLKLTYGTDLRQTKAHKDPMYKKIGGGFGIRYVFPSGIFCSMEGYVHSYNGFSALDHDFQDNGILIGLGYRIR